MKKSPKPTAEQYRVAKISLAINYAPDINPCKKCGWPVVRGYCCTACGDINPSSVS